MKENRRDEIICLVTIILTLLQFPTLSAALFDRSMVNISRQAAAKKVVGLTSCRLPLRNCQACATFPLRDMILNVERISSIVYKSPKNDSSWNQLHTPNINYHAYLFARHDLTFIPKLYTTLVHYTGPSDQDFDSFKGSFSFNFMLDVREAEAASLCWYQLMQYRSFMRINVYQREGDIDSRREELSTPFTKAQLSKHDISDLTQDFFDYLLGKLEKENCVPDPFCLTAESNLLISGFSDGQYFANKYESHD